MKLKENNKLLKLLKESFFQISLNIVLHTYLTVLLIGELVSYNLLRSNNYLNSAFDTLLKKFFFKNWLFEYFFNILEYLAFYAVF